MPLNGKPERETVSLKIAGDERFYDLMVRPMEKDNKIEGIACTSVDITDLTIAEQHLEKVKKEKDGQ